MFCCVLLGAAGRHRPSRDTGTKRTMWTDGKRNTNGIADFSHIRSEILSELHPMLHHIAWLAFILQGVEGVLGPTGIIGPSGYPVCISYSISLSEFQLPPVCFLTMMELLSVFFLSIREPRVTEEVRGRWCVVLFDKSFYVFCTLRLGQLVVLVESTLSCLCPQDPSLLFSIVCCNIAHDSWLPWNSCGYRLRAHLEPF